MGNVSLVFIVVEFKVLFEIHALILLWCKVLVFSDLLLKVFTHSCVLKVMVAFVRLVLAVSVRK